MYRKYFAWSFDDGLEQDKKIIEILKEYGMGPPSTSIPAFLEIKPMRGGLEIWA